MDNKTNYLTLLKIEMSKLTTIIFTSNLEDLNTVRGIRLMEELDDVNAAIMSLACPDFMNLSNILKRTSNIELKKIILNLLKEVDFIYV